MTSPPPPAPPPAEPSSRERDLSGHIFSVSAGLVGVCLTVIGLFRLFRKTGEVASVADNLIAIDAMVFLFACLSAYLALRATREGSWHRFERFADSLFLVGLAAMVVISALIAYELVGGWYGLRHLASACTSRAAAVSLFSAGTAGGV